MHTFLVALVVAVAAAASTAGCMTCQEQLDLHHCLPDSPRCDTQAKPTFDWDATNLTALWPELTRLMGEVQPGLHGHADWTPSQAEAFWSLYGIPASQADKDLLLRHAGELYHVRVQAC